MISKDLWDKIRPNSNPFLKYEFIQSLIDSGSATAESGWAPHIILENEAALLTFIKSHSYGEYIFDWAWAEAFERYGIPYYPKLTSIVPFTPVTTKHFLMKEFDFGKADSLIKKHDDFLMSTNLSSAHFLFLSPEEIEVFRLNNYFIRKSMQYHFFNDGYETFDHFLGTLKARKAKTIRAERHYQNLTIQKITGTELNSQHAKQMYQFYISTIANKNSFDYLNEAFFLKVFSEMKDNILYVEARRKDQPVAGSLFFYDEKKLYGRYWGSNQYVDNLHFELCYYQGIEFCIENKLSVFEAGAQGEHKIARGFRPVEIFSAHKIKHEGFKEAIDQFIREEEVQIDILIKELSEHLPFKVR